MISPMNAMPHLQGIRYAYEWRKMELFRFWHVMFLLFTCSVYMQEVQYISRALAAIDTNTCIPFQKFNQFLYTNWQSWVSLKSAIQLCKCNT